MKEVVTAGLAAAVVIVSVKLQPVPPPLLALQLPVGGSVAGENVAPDGRPLTATGSDPFPLPLMLMAYVTELDVPYWAVPTCAPTVNETTLTAAATYGPTIGPPSPTGAAPCGFTPSLDVSLSARARLTRPLPVSATEPAGSALRARRPTMTPLDADGSAARSRPAAAATIAEDADVPEIEVEPPPGAVVKMSTPGAARNTSGP